MTEKVVTFFQEKNGATPLVAGPGDTNPSDATECRPIISLILLNGSVITPCVTTSASCLLIIGLIIIIIIFVYYNYQ